MIVIQFIVVFSLVYLGYYLFYIRKSKSFNIDKSPREVLYLIQLYKIDINKIKYRNLLKIIGLVNSFIVALTFTIVTLFDKVLIMLLVTILLLFPLVMISYKLIGSYYKKKGLTKNV